MRRPRIPAIDAARGVAVVAMVLYHAAWDLSELQLLPLEVTASLGWRVFARVIAASFLLLSGVSLALAHRDGIRPRAFLRRLATVAAAALAVTLATRAAFPESYIFFGILHCIVLSSLLALPFVRLRAGFAAAAAVAIWASPFVLTQAVFDADLLAFLGLGTRVPVTNDWVPLCPWSGFVFAGIAAAKLARSRPRPIWRAGWAAAGSEGLRLAWLGRHSLPIYLLHQPILFGLLYGLVQVTGPNPRAEAAPFLRSCTESCVGGGRTEAVCRATCGCTADALRSGPVWRRVLAGRLSAEEREEVGATARSCLSRAR